MHDSVLSSSLVSEWEETSIYRESVPKKVVLFLQGPNCGFFQQLADRLEEYGHRCVRVNLCFGDWLHWRREGSFNYRGSYRNWKQYIAKFMDRENVTDLIINGDKRLYHKTAIKMANARGIRVIATDFGYLRPDWITFELGGMSGSSLFPRTPQGIKSLADEVADIDFKERYVDDNVNFATAEAISGFTTWLFYFLYPSYKPFHINNPVLLGLAYARTYLKKLLFQYRTRNKIRILHNECCDRPFYLFPLQLESDFQIRAYSSFPNQTAAIEDVLVSFAENAADNTRLLFKVHPLDPGLVNWKKTIIALSETVGVSGRIIFLPDGPLAQVILNCIGVVTINSTVGLKALQHGKKVKVMGQAVYNVPGLVFPGGLDDFWRSDFQVDRELFSAFMKALGATVQIRGAWFSKTGLESAVTEACQRVHYDMVNQVFVESPLPVPQKSY